MNAPPQSEGATCSRYLSLKSSAIPSRSSFNLAIASADAGVVPETSTWMLNLRSKPAAASVMSLIWSARSCIWFDLNSALATRTPGFVGGGGGGGGDMASSGRRSLTFLEFEYSLGQGPESSVRARIRVRIAPSIASLTGAHGSGLPAFFDSATEIESAVAVALLHASGRTSGTIAIGGR